MGSESAPSSAGKTAKSDERSRRTADVPSQRAFPALPFIGLQRVLGNRSTSQLVVAPPPSAGQPLPDAVRALFGSTNADLTARVRVHRGADAAVAADASAADALAFGHDIIFGAGRFAPATTEGVRLLAHEVAHVLQQTTTGLPVATPGVAEADAQAFAADVLAGRDTRIEYSTPRRFALQPAAPAVEKAPPRGTFRVHVQAGQFVYVYNIEDAKAWPNEKYRAFANYLKDAFPGATDAIATTYLGRFGVLLEGTDLASVPASVKTMSYLIDGTFHARVTKWMAQEHPELRAKRVTGGTRPITHEAAGGQSAGSGSGEVQDVTVHGAPRPGAGGTAKPSGDAPTRADRAPTKAATKEEDGSTYGKPGGSPNGIITYEPLGELRIAPALPVYVANSSVTARVFFETSNPFRAALNIFPNHASFDWTVYAGAKKTDSNLVSTGRIEYEIDFDDPGTYTVAVDVSSDEFADGKHLKLTSPPLRVVAESERERQVFESNLVGADRSKPFERDARGVLTAKPGFVPLSVANEIDGLNAEIAAIAELRKEGKLSEQDAQTYTAFFNEQLAGLKKLEQRVGSVAYVVSGTFLNREDSTSFSLRIFMNRTQRGVTDDGHASIDVELYDSTLSPGEPRRSRGHGESWLPANLPGAYATAELDAISSMAGDWRQYNEYPDGTLHFAVHLLEGTGDVREWVLDTHTRRKTARKVLGGVAAVGGVALLIASPFTGGLTAPVGVILLGAVEGTVAGLTIALVADSINERLRTGTFHFDATFVLDMAALVTVFVGAAGALRGLPAAAGTARNGMLIFNVGAGAFNFAMMTVATRNEMDAENAQYFASVAKVTDPVAKADLEEKHRARLAAIMGRACVSGGIILVATGVAAKAAFEPEPVSPPSSRRAPNELPIDNAPTARPPVDRPAAAKTSATASSPASANRPPQAATDVPPAPATASATNVAPPAAPPPGAGGGTTGPVPDETLALYHGTRQAGYEGVSGGIDVAHSSGANQDFGRGFYLSEDRAVADQAAGPRGGAGTGPRYVLRWDIPKSKLGKIVDVRPGGAQRASYEAFLKQPPDFVRPGFPVRPGFRTNEEYLSGLGVEQRGVVFEQFLRANNLSDADTIIGEIGTPTTSGAAALPDRVSTQVVIRSQKVADELNAITRGPASANVPGSGTPPTGGSSPPPAGGSSPPPSGAGGSPGGPQFTALGPGVRVPVQPDLKPANVLEIGAGARPTDLGLPPDPALVAVASTDLNPSRPGVTALNANEPIPPQMRGQFDTVIVNNPYGYDPDIAKLGAALKSNGRIIVQGRAPANATFNKVYENGLRRIAPPGYRVAAVESWSDPPVTGSQSPNTLGGPFNKTSGEPLARPVNARVIFEKFQAVPAGQTPESLGASIGARVVADVQAAKGTGGPSWINRVLDAVRPLTLTPSDSAGAIEAATRAAGYDHGLRTTLEDGTIVVTSARLGPNNFIIGVRPDGTIVRGTATIEVVPGAPLAARVTDVSWSP